MEEYRIYLEEIKDRKGVVVNGGYYTYSDLSKQLNGHNFPSMEYAYDRTTDLNELLIKIYYSKEDCARVMDHMRQKGYPCHAEPSFTITKKY